MTRERNNFASPVNGSLKRNASFLTFASLIKHVRNRSCQVARIVGVCLVLTSVLAAPALAQDPSGRPLPGKGKRPPKKAPPKADPLPVTVTLTLMTDPPGSSVYINGLARGVSNSEGKVVLEKLPVGRYSVEVRKEGYRPMLRGFEAGSDSPTLLFKLDVDFDVYSRE